ncbi:MAG: DUF3047 domain-containing protein [Candidatus Omnitrophica bacterium]|nr:DUF3047 domain-containing protein [Candidatus Omnitrophota bacterium]
MHCPVAWIVVLAGLVLSGLVGGCAARVKVPLLPPFPPSAAPSVLWAEPFDELHPERWREVEVRGRTSYEAITLEGRSCLKAHSRNTASILLHALRFDPQTFQRLSWSWRVERPVTGEALERKEGSDASARVYVYFETKGLPWQKRSIDYVWSTTLPAGTITESAFSSMSKILVVESGTASLGQWRMAERNLEEDYARCFGGDPPDVIAIGVMTDTDNTAGEAVAYYDDLQVSKTRKE